MALALADDASDIVASLLEARRLQRSQRSRLAQIESSTASATFGGPLPLAALLSDASAAASHLDAVAVDASTLCGSLSRLHVQAEHSVRRVRELDARRAALQLVLDRVEDLLDLRACLGGLRDAHQGGDLEATALQLKRFRAIERALEVPEADVAAARQAEAVLLERVVRDFDAALDRQQRDQLQRGGGGGGGASVGDSKEAPQSVEAVITRCCQVMSLLGRADMGLERYLAYLASSLDADCGADMRLAAGSGVDASLVALNVASSLFGRAAGALEGAGQLAEALFSRDGGPAAVLVTVHRVAERHAARIVLSFARCARMAAAMTAREQALLEAASGGALRPPPLPQQQQQLERQTSHAPAAIAVGAAQAARMLRSLEDAACDAPFAAAPEPAVAAAFALELALPAAFDSFLDEAALLLQRCASYQRLVIARAGAVDAAAAASARQLALADAHAQAQAQHPHGHGSGGLSPSSAGAAATAAAAATASAPAPVPAPAPAAAATTAEARLRAAHRLSEAAQELGGKYAALEQAFVQRGVATAVALDEVMEGGVAGASVDMMDGRLAVAATPAATVIAAASLSASATASVSASAPSPSSSASSSALALGLVSPGAGGAGADAAGAYSPGGGALCSTLVEDAFFVFHRGCKRALATGSADCAAAVVNAVVFQLQEALAAELEASFRAAVADGAAAAEAARSAQGADRGALERRQGLRAALMASPPVRMAPAWIAEYQTMEASSSAAAGGDARGAGPGLGLGLGLGRGLAFAGDGAGQGQGQSTPAKSGSGTPGGALSSSSSSGGGGGGLGGDSASAGGASGAGGGASGTAQSSAARSTARLTEETAAAALALNNTQLAAECAVRLLGVLEAEAAQTFPDAREAAKVRASLAGLADCAASLRAALEAAVATLCARLTPRLRSALNVFEGSSALIRYELSEAGLIAASDGGGAAGTGASVGAGAGAGASGAFQAEFLPSLAAILAPLQYSLTPSLAVSVVTKVASYVAKQLEPRVRRKRFNALGALQFDADVRALAAFFAARSSRRAVRDRFARLHTMARLLTLDELGDAADAFRTAGGEVSADDARAILALRVDFSAEDVARLRL